MTTLQAQSAALVLMLVALPLTSVGTLSDTPWVSALGLVVVGAGGSVASMLRWTAPASGEDDGSTEGEPTDHDDS